MSISTYTGLQTALSGLMASQQALDITGDNITNASTPGYTEQTTTLAETPRPPARPTGCSSAPASTSPATSAGRRLPRHPAARPDDAAGLGAGERERPQPGAAGDQRALDERAQLAALLLLVGLAERRRQPLRHGRRARRSSSRPRASRAASTAISSQLTTIQSQTQAQIGRPCSRSTATPTTSRASTPRSRARAGGGSSRTRCSTSATRRSTTSPRSAALEHLHQRQRQRRGQPRRGHPHRRDRPPTPSRSAEHDLTNNAVEPAVGDGRGERRHARRRDPARADDDPRLPQRR